MTGSWLSKAFNFGMVLEIFQNDSAVYSPQNHGLNHCGRNEVMGINEMVLKKNIIRKKA